jgi:histone-lysine N-methyltransferase SETMAR
MARRNPQRIFSGDKTINTVYYKAVMERLLNRIRRVRPGMFESGDWLLLHDNAPSHNATIFKQFLAQRKITVLNHPPYSPDLTPADYFLFPKVKSHLKGCLFDSISDIQKAVTSTLNTTAKDDFYKDIQKLYDRANLCVLNNKSVISFMQILFIMPVLKLNGHSVYYIFYSYI